MTEVKFFETQFILFFIFQYKSMYDEDRFEKVINFQLYLMKF